MSDIISLSLERSLRDKTNPYQRREALWSAFWKHASNYPDAMKGLEQLAADYQHCIPEVQHLIDWIFGHLCNQSLPALMEIAEKGDSEYRQARLACPCDVKSVTFKTGSWSQCGEHLVG